jgi:hypothetical protein
MGSCLALFLPVSVSDAGIWDLGNVFASLNTLVPKFEIAADVRSFP